MCGCIKVMGNMAEVLTSLIESLPTENKSLFLNQAGKMSKL